MLVEIGEELPEDLSEAMAALTPRMRQFVRLYIEYPQHSHAKLARAAGYSDVKDGAKVRAWECLHRPKVLRAITEELERRFRSHAALGLQVLVEVAKDPDHPRRVQAAEALLNRGGGSLSRVSSGSGSSTAMSPPHR
jgi:hypothetical protein